MNAPSKPLPIVETIARHYALNVRNHVMEASIADVLAGNATMREYYDVDESIADVFQSVMRREHYDASDVEAGRCTDQQRVADEDLMGHAEQFAARASYWFDDEVIARAVASLGYIEEQTGGGCTAYERAVAGNRGFVITDYDAPSVPNWGARIVVGYYDQWSDDRIDLGYVTLDFTEPTGDVEPFLLGTPPMGTYSISTLDKTGECPPELLDEARAIVDAINGDKSPAPAPSAPKWAPGTVGAEICAELRAVVHPEILGIEATSCVGEAVVELCRAVGTALAIRTADHVGPGSSIDPKYRDALRAAVVGQSNLWYFG